MPVCVKISENAWWSSLILFIQSHIFHLHIYTIPPSVSELFPLPLGQMCCNDAFLHQVLNWGVDCVDCYKTGRNRNCIVLQLSLVKTSCVCSVLDETTWWKKSASNHYETGKQGIARAAKKIVEMLTDNTLALGSAKRKIQSNVSSLIYLQEPIS